MSSGETPSAATVTHVANSALYVGDLPVDITEQELTDLFALHGPVRSVRIPVDVVTRRPRGYAYVNFEKAEDAAVAMDALNYSKFKGKEIRIMWSQRDPSLRRSGAGNVFVKGLAKTITSRQLHDTFSEIGEILSCKVKTNPVTGESLGYGFVHFETQKAADEAVRRIDGLLLLEMKLSVQPFVPAKQRQGVADRFTNCYVKNFEETVTRDQLILEFSKFGPIRSAVVVTEADGRSRCFGFVDFETHEAAVAAIEGLNDKALPGGAKKLFVGRAMKKIERMTELKKRSEEHRMSVATKSRGLNMYVKNLDDSVDHDKLREFFSDCGTITSAKVMMMEEGGVSRSKGFGFVCFSNLEEARRALLKDGSTALCSKPIKVRYAMPKEERRRQLEHYFSNVVQAGGAPPAFVGMPSNPQMMPVPMMPYMPPRAAAFPPPSMAPVAMSPFGYGPPQQPMINQRMWAGSAGYPVPGWQFPQQPRRGTGGGRRGGAFPPGGRPPRSLGQAASAYRGPPAGVMPGRGFPGGPVEPAVASSAFAAAPVAPVAPVEADLSGKPDEERRRILGEALFVRVCQVNPKPERSPKVTGMLLALGESEVTRFFHDLPYLTARVNEALTELDNAEHSMEAVTGPVDHLPQ